MYKDYEIKLNAILDKHKGVQKVELGLVQDLIKETDKVSNQIKKMKQASDDFLNAKKEAISERKKSEEVKKKSFNIIDKVLKAAKNLGIDPFKIPEVKQLRTKQDELITEFQRVPFK